MSEDDKLITRLREQLAAEYDRIASLRTIVADACDSLRWYAVRQVDLGEGQPYLDSADKGYHLAKDQQCWGDALLDEINELEWAINDEGEE